MYMYKYISIYIKINIYIYIYIYIQLFHTFIYVYTVWFEHLKRIVRTLGACCSNTQNRRRAAPALRCLAH